MAQDSISSFAYHGGWILGVLALLYHLVFVFGPGRGIYNAIRVSPLNLFELGIFLLVFSTAHQVNRSGGV